METGQQLRVCLIGTGYMGKCHALAWNAVGPTFEDVPKPRLELLVEVNDRLAAKRAEELAFARSTGDWQSAVEDPAVDVVSIASPTWFHSEMAIAALASGKHVWCEKPMSLKLSDSEKMADAAAKAGTIVVLGYNYIQNPAIRLIKKLIREGAIGEVNHVRVEMDEDYMADPDTPYNSFFSGPQAGGALEEFGVHPLSLLQTLVGDVAAACADQWKPYATRRDADGVNQPVATHDIAGALLRLDNGASGIFVVNRAAWGRKGRLVVQLYGSRGSIYFDQERLNEMRLYTSSDDPALHGYRQILNGPLHPPYHKFVPTPGHGLGFNDLKVIECREFLKAIAGEPAHIIDFNKGLRIERSIDTLARSVNSRTWEQVIQ
jgi:predicted dehydrogenase